MSALPVFLLEPTWAPALDVRPRPLAARVRTSSPLPGLEDVRALQLRLEARASKHAPPASLPPERGSLAGGPCFASRAERAGEIVGNVSVPGPAWTCSEGEYLKHLAAVGHYLGTPEGARFAHATAVEDERHRTRAERYARQRALSPLYPEAMRVCRHRRFDADGATVIVHQDGTSRWHGLVSCNRRSGCEHCGPRLLARDAELVQALVEDHGHERTLMLTLTLRHWKRLPLKPLRQGLVDSFRSMLAHREWRTCAELDDVQMVRALEVPFGEHGFHPHLHVLLLLGVTPTSAEVEALRSWVQGLWRDCVDRTMGRAFRPTLEHGAHLTWCHRGDYLTKLGLEIADAGQSKTGRGRTYWQLARDWIARGCNLDDPLTPTLREFLDGMHGAKIVTWAPGLKARAEGLFEEDPSPERERALVSAMRWDVVRNLRDADGRDVRALVLQAAERAQPGEVQSAVDAVVENALQRAPPFARGSPPHLGRVGFVALVGENDGARGAATLPP